MLNFLIDVCAPLGIVCLFISDARTVEPYLSL